VSLGSSASAKLSVSEAAVETALDAIRLHGAMGLRREEGLERALRDAMMGLVYSGTSDVMRNLMATAEGI
jgi:alkylation response protein AidB-like acyl-CoA dehydrogenase